MPSKITNEAKRWLIINKYLITYHWWFKIMFLETWKLILLSWCVYFVVRKLIRYECWFSCHGDRCFVVIISKMLLCFVCILCVETIKHVHLKIICFNGPLKLWLKFKLSSLWRTCFLNFLSSNLWFVFPNLTCSISRDIFEFITFA